MIVPPFYPPGTKQVVSDIKHDIIVNPSHPVRNFTLCCNCKSVTNCPRRAELKMSASEYFLIRDDCNVQLALIACLDAMPIAPSLKGSVLGNVSSDFLKANFIIHLASLIE